MHLDRAGIGGPWLRLLSAHAMGTELAMAKVRPPRASTMVAMPSLTLRSRCFIDMFLSGVMLCFAVLRFGCCSSRFDWREHPCVSCCWFFSRSAEIAPSLRLSSKSLVLSEWLRTRAIERPQGSAGSVLCPSQATNDTTIHQLLARSPTYP